MVEFQHRARMYWIPATFWTFVLQQTFIPRNKFARNIAIYVTSVRTFLSIAILILGSIYTCNHIYCNSRNNVCKSIILVDGVWSGWVSWSDCDVTCGSGTQSRGRSCDNPAPANGGDVCSGSAVETTQCTLDICPGNAPSLHWLTVLHAYTLNS